MAPPDLAIDPAEIEQRLFAFAAHGAHGETGVWRPVYSPEWVEAAETYARWGREAGLEVSQDAVGNVWARLPGTESGTSIVAGSHIDSQKPGGRYDGALGTVGALIALATLRERCGAPKRTLEAVALCEEEASRFPSATFWGSRAICGEIAPGEAETILGEESETIADAMRAIGLDPAAIPAARRDDIEVFLELHIEQGPVLEAAGYSAGIVEAITGIRHYVVELTGESNHAGAFPMDIRRDPMAGAAEIISGVINTAERMGRPAVTTVGRIAAEPGGHAIVPRRVTFTIDARHPDSVQRALLYARHEGLMREVADRRGLELNLTCTVDQVPGPCDPELIELLGRVAVEEGIATMRLASGAVHDALLMGRHVRAGMIFVRSMDGRSHTPEEYSSPEDCAAGVQLLTAALHRLAY
jgi:allantoate deiminase